MSIQASCKLLNTTQATMKVYLKADHYFAVTYGCDLRLGVNGEDSFLNHRGVPDKVLIVSENGGKLVLSLGHGRDTTDQDMEDWGCEPEGELPSFDGAVITAEGVALIKYKVDQSGQWDTVFIPYVGDLLLYDGKYYGDFSIDNKGAVL